MTVAGELPSEVMGALGLLYVPHGGRGCGTAYVAIIEALRRRIEVAIPAMCFEIRKALLEAAWSFSSLSECRSVTATLLETWSGGLPSELAKMVHDWPEDAFLRLPRLIRWKSSRLPRKYSSPNPKVLS